MSNTSKKRKINDSRSTSICSENIVVRLYRGAQVLNGEVLIDTESNAKTNPAYIIGELEISPDASLEKCVDDIARDYDISNGTGRHEGCASRATPLHFKLFKITNDKKVVSKPGALHVVQKRICLEITDISAIKLRTGLFLEFVQVSTDALEEHVKGGNAATSASYVQVALSQGKAKHIGCVLTRGGIKSHGLFSIARFKPNITDAAKNGAIDEVFTLLAALLSPGNVDCALVKCVPRCARTVSIFADILHHLYVMLCCSLGLTAH